MTRSRIYIEFIGLQNISIKDKGEQMTNKINLVINLSILALLIYLSVSVKTLQDKVFTDPNIMIPMTGSFDQTDEMSYNIQKFLNTILKQAINEMEQ